MKDEEREPFHWDQHGAETTFVENMRMLREQRGMTQTELARRAQEQGLPFHQVTVQRIESGQRPVKLTESIVIASILGSQLQTMMDELSLPFAYDFLVHESAWDRLSGTLDRSSDNAKGLSWTTTAIREALEDYERAAVRFGEDPEAHLTRYATAVLERLDRAVEILREADAQVAALATEIKRLDTGFPNQHHGGRPYLDERGSSETPD